MKKEQIIVNDEYRMKIVNFLKIYGYYNGILVSLDYEKKYVSGELLLTDVIQSKKDFKELKMSVNKVFDYCYENGFKEIESVMEYFYKNECKVIKKHYGGFFDKF